MWYFVFLFLKMFRGWESGRCSMLPMGKVMVTVSFGRHGWWKNIIFTVSPPLFQFPLPHSSAPTYNITIIIGNFKGRCASFSFCFSTLIVRGQTPASVISRLGSKAAAGVSAFFVFSSRPRVSQGT